MSVTPPHLETRLAKDLRDAQDLARQKGLTELFALELHAAAASVREALSAHTRTRALTAAREVAALKARLRQAPAKPRRRGGVAGGEHRGPVMGRRKG